MVENVETMVPVKIFQPIDVQITGSNTFTSGTGTVTLKGNTLVDSTCSDVGHGVTEVSPGLMPEMVPDMVIDIFDMEFGWDFNRKRMKMGFDGYEWCFQWLFWRDFWMGFI